MTQVAKTFAGLVTFTRGSTGTHVDGTGVVVSAAADDERFDHDPVMVSAKGLLMEEARTNLALWGSDFTNAAWTKTNMTAAKTATGPDGASNSASTLTATAANATALQAITDASASRVSSCWIRRRTGTGAVQITQDNGGTWSAITVTSAWRPVALAPATLANPTVGLRLVTNTDAVDVSYFQHERGAFASSSIPATSAAVARSADSAVISGSSFAQWWNAEAGTVVLGAESPGLGTRVVWQADDGTASNRITVWTSEADLKCTVVSGGATVADLTAGTITRNRTFGVALAFSANDFAVSLGGSAAVVDSAGPVPAVDRARLCGDTSGNQLGGRLSAFQYHPRRASNGELRSLSAAAESSGGAFFDSAIQPFTALDYTSGGGLTVSAGGVDFVSSGATSKQMKLKDDRGDPLKLCFDKFEIDGTFEVNSFPAAAVNGLLMGFINDDFVGWGVGGAAINAHGGSAAIALYGLVNTNQVDGYAGNGNTPHVVRVRYSKDILAATVTVNIDGGADQTYTRTFIPVSKPAPPLFSQPCVDFKQGDFSMNSLRVSAPYHGAHFICIGDSLTAGASATPQTLGWAFLLREQFPAEVRIAGAPSATIANWVASFGAVRMGQHNYAPICLGTNNWIGGIGQSDTQAQMTALLALCDDAGVIPILMSSPPIGNSAVPTFNTWLAGLGRHYVDIYAALVGTGTALAAAYNSGDGVHWNNAGHALVKGLLADFIASEGLAPAA